MRLASLGTSDYRHCVNNNMDLVTIATGDASRPATPPGPPAGVLVEAVYVAAGACAYFNYRAAGPLPVSDASTPGSSISEPVTGME